MASEKDNINSYLSNSVCICVNDDFLCIGIVQHIESDLKVVLLKDARFITLNVQDKVGITEIVSSVTSYESFTSICSSMSTPIEYFVFSNPKYILSVVDEIKRMYVSATKNDKAAIRSSNPNSWKKTNKQSSWEL